LSLLCFVFLFGHGVHWFQSGGAVVQGWAEAMGSPPLTGSESVPGALRRMLTYWGGQQHNPRLPGRHDYYLVLLALYELPIVVAAIGGIVYAGRRRTPFTDLLLWWAITSCLIYALANEKVPWLMMHILLPLGLLAANWLAAVQQRSQWASRVVAVMGMVGAIYLVRGTLAANFERPADHHEPMLYAQTTEEFGDAFRQSLLETRGEPGDFWVHPAKQWPLAWYLRDSKARLGSATQWAALPAPGGTLRMAVHLSPGDWQSQIDQKKLTSARYRQFQQQLAGMHSRQTSFYIWPRASWSALRPDRWARWWWNRQASLENGVLSEWSDSPVVISVRG
jgi:predicted membrane-bound mannosyltransferase